MALLLIVIFYLGYAYSGDSCRGELVKPGRLGQPAVIGQLLAGSYWGRAFLAQSREGPTSNLSNQFARSPNAQWCLLPDRVLPDTNRRLLKLPSSQQGSISFVKIAAVLREVDYFRRNDTSDKRTEHVVTLGAQLSLTSSIFTRNSASVWLPHAVVIGTSLASQPRAMTMRPIRRRFCIG
jgi:hypothetical protein